jgi:hypothetical protein
MTDTYTKIILTVIAACLVAIAVRQAPSSANAQFGLGCDGSPQSAVLCPANTVSGWLGLSIRLLKICKRPRAAGRGASFARIVRSAVSLRLAISIPRV